MKIFYLKFEVAINSGLPKMRGFLSPDFMNPGY